MAIIQVAFDTKTKKCVATLNGRTIDNLSSINIYTYGEDDKQTAEIALSTRMLMEDDKMVVTTTVYASEIKDNVVSIDELETYVNEQVNKTRSAVANWLEK